MKDLDRLLNPNKRFLEYRDYLIDLISCSYHKSFKDIISTRIKDAIYFFDSTPDVTYDLLEKYNSNLDALKRYNALKEDYNSVGCKLRKEIDNYISKYLKELLNLDEDIFNKNKEVILTLRFDAFSKKYKEYLTSNDKELKDLVKRLQQEYLDTCKMIGINPLLDEERIEECLDFLAREEKILERCVITNTIFGKNILKSSENTKTLPFYHKVNLLRSLIYFEDDFYYDVDAITLLYKTKDYYKTFLSFPLIKNYYNKGLDINLLHELIHVSEMNDKYCSFVINKDYSIFNEFRTQDKARYLFKRLREDNIYIFDQNGNDDSLYKSAYDFYLPLVNPILDNYRNLFDFSAINNSISSINKNLGKDNFNEYCCFLTNIYENNFNIHNQSFDVDTISKNNDLIDKIKTYKK